MLDRLGRRIRYEAGNAIRFASRPWRQSAVSIDNATTLFGCSFGRAGWHHLRQTLKEYDRNPQIAVEATTLWRFLTHFQPTSISVLAGVTGEAPLPLFTFPWGTFVRGEITSSKNALASRFCGPSTAQFIVEEFHRTLELYREMAVHGYRPTEFPNSHISGSWLERANGERRFVVLQGNHRMAILAHLGVDQVEVRVMPGRLPLVQETGAASWPHVTSGRISEEHARRIFNFYFTENGRHIEQLLDSGKAS
jgi:hypothetical protein